MLEPTPTSEPQAAPTPTATATYLGPAEVVEAANSARKTVVVALATDDRPRVPAALAFTFPYEPAVGDTLLVLYQGDDYYAVGVLAGSSATPLVFPGATDIRAVAGKLTLASDQAVELRAPRITIRTGLLRTIANNVVEKSDQVRRWVRGLFALRAGESRRVIDGEDSTRCQNSTTIAKETVKVDGDQLHLGH